MLFTSEEKNMLTGALVTGIVDTALEGYYAYQSGTGHDPKANVNDPLYYLYYSINPWLPDVDDLIALLGVPGLLYVLGRKNRKLKYMAFGGLVYGISEIAGQYAVKISKVAAGQSVALHWRVVGVGGR